MRNVARKFAMLGCAALALAAAGASPQPAVAQVAARASGASDLPSRERGPQICFDDIFYGPMPGKANYCLGLRAWNHGDYRNGLEFFKLAAGWGNKNAQYTLGLIYFNGHHVTANPPLGFAWLELANQRHDDARIALVTRSVEEALTPAQRRQAKRLFRRMRTTYGDKVATVRAWRHLRHWQRSHSLANQGVHCLSGRELYVALHEGIPGVTPVAAGGAHSVVGNDGQREAPCSGITLQMRHHLVQGSADTYFRGWSSSVTVGPLKQVPAAASSSAH